MARTSYFILCGMNIITFLISMAIVAHVSYAWRLPIQLYGSSPSATFLKTPILILGISLLILSVMGLVALLCHLIFLHRIYLWVILFITISLLIFIIFSLLVTNKGPQGIGSSSREFRVNEFSSWMQTHLVGKNHWFDIKKYLLDYEVCDSFQRKLDALPAAILWEVVTSVELGCCKPPYSCGYKFKNISYWEVSNSGNESKEKDCNSWKNDKEILCYDCNSCKAGYLEEGVSPCKTTQKPIMTVIDLPVSLLDGV
ncbi:tetraspanin-8 [Manihot esculenta]|uniref:tetraspanin-8 n=1 Tax=Manihot esculenta TaxID=3983 RepID=UPI001CC43508|nr:tetraspanin-8 [Manihot esculenta]